MLSVIMLSVVRLNVTYNPSVLSVGALRYKTRHTLAYFTKLKITTAQFL